MRGSAIFALALCTLAVAARAQTPTVMVEKAACVPTEANGVINATIQPEIGGAEPRLYFRWDQHGAMYYVDLFAEGAGQYWAIPAKPEPRNENIEYYVALVDPAGKTVARSETQLSPVRDDCAVNMTAKQLGVSNNLTVGETVPAQQGRRVLGFLCDGVVTRVNFEGIMRPDEICRGCVVPFFTKEAYLAPVAIGAVTTVIIEPPPPETSTSRP